MFGFGRKRRQEEERRRQRRTDAWADMLITQHDLHRFNEDICLLGDEPYYDCCPAIGDGHGHLRPDWPFYAGWEPYPFERQGRE